MSSHHIVREKQEPALLVQGLDNFPEELLGQLLEWSPTIFACRQAAEKLILRNIKIDWIAGDSNNIADFQSDVKFLEAENGKSTEAVLTFLTANGYPSVNIITDHFNLKDYEFYVDKINIVIFFNNKRVYAIKTGFSKWKPAGETIALLSKVNAMDTKGLEKIGPNLFKTMDDGFFSLSFDSPFLFIAEDL